MSNRWKRPSASLLAFALLCTLLTFIPGSLSAEDSPKGAPATTVQATAAQDPYYQLVLQEWKTKGIAAGQTPVTIPANRIARKAEDGSVQVGAYAQAVEAVRFAKPEGWVEYEIDADRDGLYELWMEYTALKIDEGGTRQPLVASVSWNGEYPYLEARSVRLQRKFTDQLPDKYDEDGNQVRALIDESAGWQSGPLRDSGGASALPLLWYVKKGKNVIRIEASTQPFALKSIALKAQETLPAYADVQSAAKSQSSATGDPIVIEAERATFKSSTSILTRYDRDPLTTPKSLSNIRFNTLGGPNWSKGGQAVEWTFTVPSDGLYKIGLRGNQSFQKNLSVFRTVSIDGKIPFREMLHVPFRYSPGWKNYILQSDQGTPYEFFFTRGEHTLKMESTYEPYMPIIIEIDQISKELRSISLDIRAATGNREDRFRVWDVEADMPWLIDRLAAQEKQLRVLSDKMVQINGVADNVSQALRSAAKDISSLLKDPNEIPNSQLTLGTTQQNLDNQRAILMNTPLQLDKIDIVPKNGDFPRMKANLFEKLSGMLASLRYSFSNRNQLNEQRDDELNVWMLWGRDYVDTLQQLADEQFTPKYGIKVRINLVQSADLLILGQAAGILPDVALGVPSDKPFELAIRGAAVDLSSMPGGKETLAKYSPGTLLPYFYKEGYYGIPETMNQKVLFYRKDILRHLGLSVPNTWEDVYRMLPTLLQNNYNFYVDPNDFTAMFFQNGGKMYEQDGKTTGLNQPESFQSFKLWTDLFNKHGMERQVVSFYNNFRRGTMPIGIADFNQYMQLLVAAPEIMNEWGIAPVPGTVQPDGSIARWIGGVQTVSTMLFQQTPEHKKDVAWEFLKWYLSDETQTQYGLNLEQYGGETFRWNSANVKAFRNMPWKPEDLNVFLNQWQWYKEVPSVPGGYMTTRELGFAWIRTTVNGEPYRRSLEKAVKEINRELGRKQREFNLVNEDGSVSQPLHLPVINKPWEGAKNDAR